MREDDSDATLADTSVLQYDASGLIEQWDLEQDRREATSAIGMEPVRRVDSELDT